MRVRPAVVPRAPITCRCSSSSEPSRIRQNPSSCPLMCRSRAHLRAPCPSASQARRRSTHVAHIPRHRRPRWKGRCLSSSGRSCSASQGAACWCIDATQNQTHARDTIPQALGINTRPRLDQSEILPHHGRQKKVVTMPFWCRKCAPRSAVAMRAPSSSSSSSSSPRRPNTAPRTRPRLDHKGSLPRHGTQTKVVDMALRCWKHAPSGQRLEWGQ